MLASHLSLGWTPFPRCVADTVSKHIPLSVKSRNRTCTFLQGRAMPAWYQHWYERLLVLLGAEKLAQYDTDDSRPGPAAVPHSAPRQAGPASPHSPPSQSAPPPASRRSPPASSQPATHGSPPSGAPESAVSSPPPLSANCDVPLISRSDSGSCPLLADPARGSSGSTLARSLGPLSWLRRRAASSATSTGPKNGS